MFATRVRYINSLLTFDNAAVLLIAKLDWATKIARFCFTL